MPKRSHNLIRKYNSWHSLDTGVTGKGVTLYSSLFPLWLLDNRQIKYQPPVEQANLQTEFKDSLVKSIEM